MGLGCGCLVTWRDLGVILELVGGGVVIRIYQILADIFAIYFGPGEPKGGRVWVE